MFLSQHPGHDVVQTLADPTPAELALGGVTEWPPRAG